MLSLVLTAQNSTWCVWFTLAQLSVQLHPLLTSSSVTQEGNAGRFGVIAGRVVNRIGNATFTLDGTRYQVRQGLPVMMQKVRYRLTGMRYGHS